MSEEKTRALLRGWYSGKADACNNIVEIMDAIEETADNGLCYSSGSPWSLLKYAVAKEKHFAEMSKAGETKPFPDYYEWLDREDEK